MYKLRPIPLCPCLYPVIVWSVCSPPVPLFVSRTSPASSWCTPLDHVISTRSTTRLSQNPLYLSRRPSRSSHRPTTDRVCAVSSRPVLAPCHRDGICNFQHHHDNTRSTFALPTTIQPRFTHPFYQPRSPMLVILTTCMFTTNHLAHPPADQCHLLITQSLTNPVSCHIRVTAVRQSSEHFQLCSTTRRLAQTLTLYITNT